MQTGVWIRLGCLILVSAGTAWAQADASADASAPAPRPIRCFAPSSAGVAGMCGWAGNGGYGGTYTGGGNGGDGGTYSGGFGGDSGGTSSGGSTNVCIPGQQVACACLRGGSGVQICAADGTQFQSCHCPSNDGGVFASGGTSSGGASAAGSSNNNTGSGGHAGTASSSGKSGGGCTLRCVPPKSNNLWLTLVAVAGLVMGRRRSVPTNRVTNSTR